MNKKKIILIVSFLILLCLGVLYFTSINNQKVVISDQKEENENQEKEIVSNQIPELESLIEELKTDQVFEELGKLGITSNINYDYDTTKPNYYILEIDVKEGDIIPKDKKANITININEEWEKTHSKDEFLKPMIDVTNKSSNIAIDMLNEFGITDITVETYFGKLKDTSITIGTIINQSIPPETMVLTEEYCFTEEDPNLSLILEVYGGDEEF